MFMYSGNGDRLSLMIFAAVDSLLILTGMFGGIFIRFADDPGSFFLGGYPIIKLMLVMFLIQTGFYYFDLYEPRVCAERKRMLILLSESLVVSSVLIFVIYYLMPTVQIGRGTLSLSFLFIFVLTFLWRLVYARVFNSKSSKEKVLIIGTGPLARKIGDEITHNGYDGFEIVGFVDERREKIGERV